jgi:hypothetical protein
MLGYCGLRDLHPRNDIVDRPFLAIAEKADDLSPPPLRDGIENIASRRRPSHSFLYITISEHISSIPIDKALGGYSLPQVPGLAQTRGKPTCSNRRLVFAFLSILPYHELVS